MSKDLHSDTALDNIQSQIHAVRLENRRLKLLGVLTLALTGATMVWTARQVRLPEVNAASTKDGILHVRGLIVEDEHGVERVRLGAPLPDPMGVDGKRHKRQGVISGILISDAKGTERGGYVTADASDEAFFTLDSRKGQEVLFLANPDGGTNLDLFDKSGNEAQLTVFPEGPKFTMKRQNKIVAQIPMEVTTTK